MMCPNKCIYQRGKLLLIIPKGTPNIQLCDFGQCHQSHLNVPLTLKLKHEEFVVEVSEFPLSSERSYFHTLSFLTHFSLSSQTGDVLGSSLSLQYYNSDSLVLLHSFNDVVYKKCYILVSVCIKFAFPSPLQLYIFILEFLLV